MASHRTAVTATVLLLLAAPLTACAEPDDDCTTDLSMAPVARSAPLKPGPGGARSGGSRSSVTKPKPGSKAKPEAKPKSRHKTGSHHGDRCDEKD